jgi:hypothetical protein
MKTGLKGMAALAAAFMLLTATPSPARADSWQFIWGQNGFFSNAVPQQRVIYAPPNARKIYVYPGTKVIYKGRQPDCDDDHHDKHHHGHDNDRDRDHDRDGDWRRQSNYSYAPVWYYYYRN